MTDQEMRAFLKKLSADDIRALFGIIMGRREINPYMVVKEIKHHFLIEGQIEIQRGLTGEQL